MPIPGSPVRKTTPPLPARAASTAARAGGELALAPDQRRLRALEPARRATASPRRPSDLDRGEGFGLPLQLER